MIQRNAATNEVMVGPKASLAAVGCTAQESNWLIDPPMEWRPCAAKIRYNAEPVPARVRVTGDDSLEVRFDDIQYGVAPGQAVVCYDDDVVLGGGWIDGAISAE